MNGINNDVAFRGMLGDKFVQEITVYHRNLTANTLLQASKSKLVGLDSGKVTDIFESFITGLTKEAKEKHTLQERLNSLSKEVPERIKEAIKATEDSIFPSVKSALAAKDDEIVEKERTIRELRRYEAMAKVKSLDEIGTVMPETAIATAQEMREHQQEAEESMLTYLLTGKGQEAALQQTERSNIMIKAMEDGITQIPHVADAIQGVNFADTGFYLKRLMETALRSEEGSVILSPVLRNQVKDNMLGLLLPHANEKYSNTGIEGIKRETDSTLEELVQFHQRLAKRKQEIRNEFPHPISKIVYDSSENLIRLYNNDENLYAQCYSFI